ncbi:oxidoreductase [Lentzea sp. CA-135723]|uniref:oxidoreductase n=1 Tax=Lentzea sp. CA-135723 TaxID=3239950 RepID=UPI003D8CB703
MKADQTGKRVALVTGASSGMGRDLALRLLRSGWTVYGLARRVERMQEITAAGGVALGVDLTDDASMVAAVEQVVAERGRIDLLVNSAGYGQMGALEDVPTDVGRRQMDVNLYGVSRMVQLCLPHMRAQKSGRIINVSSIGGKASFPLGGWYHASKFALEGYSDALRMEVKPFGVDVIVVEPGGTESEWFPIATAEAKRYSGEGAYRDMVSAMVDSPNWNQKQPPVSTVTDGIMKAINAKRPKARYVPGRSAKMIVTLRWLLSDRLYDRVIMSQYTSRPSAAKTPPHNRSRAKTSA